MNKNIIISIVIIIILVILISVSGAYTCYHYYSRESFTQNPSIFISVPSYRDKDCKNTVNDIFRKAKHPERVFIGACEQNSDDTEEKCIDEECLYPDNVRLLSISYKDAKGPLYARALINHNLYNGEDYYLMIDAHTRFRDNWDTNLINQLEYLHKTVERPILSCYPAGFSSTDNKLDDDNNTTHICEISGGDKYPTVAIARTVDGGKFRKGMLLAAGNLFTYGKFVNEVKFDPTLYHLFNGEEILLALLAYTNGWDIYSPSSNNIYHEYNDGTQDRNSWFDDNLKDDEGERTLESNALEKLKKILFDDKFSKNYKYGVGNKRKISDFWDELGWKDGKYTKEKFWCEKSPIIDYPLIEEFTTDIPETNSYLIGVM